MDEYSLIVFHNGLFDAFMAFLLAGKVKRFPIWGYTHNYICGLSVNTRICTVRMHDQRNLQSSEKFLLFFFVFSANSFPSPLTMPFEMFSFPSVGSDRNFLLLSMDTQQSLFSR